RRTGDQTCADESGSVTRGGTVRGRILTTLSAQLGYREQRSSSEQLGFGTGPSQVTLISSAERVVRPAVAVTWRGGVSTSFDASRTRSDQFNAGTLFHTQRNQQSANVAFAFRPPAQLMRLKN